MSAASLLNKVESKIAYCENVSYHIETVSDSENRVSFAGCNVVIIIKDDSPSGNYYINVENALSHTDETMFWTNWESIEHFLEEIIYAAE